MSNNGNGHGTEIQAAAREAQKTLDAEGMARSAKKVRDNAKMERRRVREHLQKDEDLMSLSKADRDLINEIIALDGLSIPRQRQLSIRLKADGKMRRVFERINWAFLKSHESVLMRALVAKALEGSEKSQMLVWQLIGKLPAGGRMMDTPETPISEQSKKTLEQRIKQLEDKRDAK